MRTSVAMCTFNGAEFLQAQLESIARQTRVPDELVVCDDGSSDDTLPILQRFAASAPFPVRIEQNNETLGTLRNFQKAMSLCEGEIIFLSDQDDVWLEHKVERLTQEMERDASAQLLFTQGEVVTSTLAPAGYTLWDGAWFTPRSRELVAQNRAIEVLVHFEIAVGATFALRRSLLGMAFPMPELAVGHDGWLALMASAIGGFRAIPEPLIRYRVHGANQVGLRRGGLLSQYRAAKKQVQIDFFRYAAEFHEAAHQRLMQARGEGYAVSEDALRRIREKAEHSRKRQHMSGNVIKRLPTIVAEAIRMRYSRYSFGWKSIAQDIFLR